MIILSSKIAAYIFVYGLQYKVFIVNDLIFSETCQGFCEFATCLH